MQAATKEAETISWALLLGVENGRETDLNHQRRKERDDERQNWINVNPHHADLGCEYVTALPGRGFNGHGALTLKQTAHDFHGGSASVHLSFSNGSFARFIKSLSCLAAGFIF